MSLSIKEEEEEGKKEKVVGGGSEGRVWDGWRGGMMSIIFHRAKR